MNRDIRVPAWILIEWIADEHRMPAGIGLPVGPLREIGYAIERAIDSAPDAVRYRRLRASLPSSTGRPIVSASTMPHVTDPRHDGVGYTAESLDDVLDA